MKHFKLSTALIFAVMALAPMSPSFAVPVMEIHIEDILSQAGDVKKSLNLTPNQQILWQQTESKMHAIVGLRRTRRDHLQADLKRGLDDSRTELRDLSTRVDTETDITHQENKQLRELWLTINDALDDNQRKIVLMFLADQLQRIADYGQEPKPAKQDGESHKHGRDRMKSGGMGGDVRQ